MPAPTRRIHIGGPQTTLLIALLIFSTNSIYLSFFIQIVWMPSGSKTECRDCHGTPFKSANHWYDPCSVTSSHDDIYYRAILENSKNKICWYGKFYKTPFVFSTFSHRDRAFFIIIASRTFSAMPSAVIA